MDTNPPQFPTSWGSYHHVPEQSAPRSQFFNGVTPYHQPHNPPMNVQLFPQTQLFGNNGVPTTVNYPHEGCEKPPTKRKRRNSEPVQNRSYPDQFVQHPPNLDHDLIQEDQPLIKELQKLFKYETWCQAHDIILKAARAGTIKLEKRRGWIGFGIRITETKKKTYEVPWSSVSSVQVDCTHLKNFCHERYDPTEELSDNVHERFFYIAPDRFSSPPTFLKTVWVHPSISPGQWFNIWPSEHFATMESWIRKHPDDFIKKYLSQPYYLESPTYKARRSLWDYFSIPIFIVNIANTDSQSLEFPEAIWARDSPELLFFGSVHLNPGIQRRLHNYLDLEIFDIVNYIFRGHFRKSGGYLCKNPKGPNRPFGYIAIEKLLKIFCPSDPISSVEDKFEAVKAQVWSWYQLSYDDLDEDNFMTVVIHKSV